MRHVAQVTPTCDSDTASPTCDSDHNSYTWLRHNSSFTQFLRASTETLACDSDTKTLTLRRAPNSKNSYTWCRTKTKLVCITTIICLPISLHLGSLKVHNHEIFLKTLFCRNRILMVSRACNARFRKSYAFRRNIRLVNISAYAQPAMKYVPRMLSSAIAKF